MQFASDRVLFDITREQADRLVRCGQISWVREPRVARVTAMWAQGHRHPCRTVISRIRDKQGREDPHLVRQASIGMNQDYTLTEIHPGKVDGLKPIFPEDQLSFLPRSTPAKAVYYFSTLCGASP